MTITFICIALLGLFILTMEFAKHKNKTTARYDNYNANFSKIFNDIGTLQADVIRLNAASDINRQAVTDYVRLHLELKKEVTRIDENQNRECNLLVAVGHDFNKIESRIDDIAAVSKDNALIVDSIAQLVDEVTAPKVAPMKKKRGVRR